MKPLTLSVAVPCYNGAAYLAATLESLLAQTRAAARSPPLIRSGC